MLFSSLTFLIWFLPAVLALHTLLPGRARNGFLLGASVFFYCMGDARYLPLLLVLGLVNYGCARGLERSGGWIRLGLTALCVGANVAALGYYKYAGLLLPALEAPPLPLGISFYVFQSLSYVLDVRAGRIRAETSFLRFATYIMLFPQLIAGPIVRYSDVAGELRERRVTAEDLEAGMAAFVVGLSAKVLLANDLGLLFENLLAVEARGALGSWAALLACGFQYYYDFAGYSLMAVGIGRMLGFRFPRNFNHPFAACSVADFWRRWHITLGEWLKTYIYIPLGGSRRGKVRLAVNLLLTWGLSGLWHGAGYNFLAWGLYFGALLVLERLLIGPWLARHRGWGHVYAFAAVLLSWVLFSFASPAEMADFAAQLFAPTMGRNVLFLLACSAAPLGLAALFAVPAVCGGCQRALEQHAVLRCAALLTLLALCVMELVGAQYNPFLYFRF